MAEIPQIDTIKNDSHKVQHRSPAIRQIISSLSQKDKATVLDLGAKIAANMEVWRSCCKEVYVEDLSASIRWREATGKPGEVTLSPQALNFEADTRFDAIIFWDILNYCPRELTQQIINRLAVHFKPNCKLIVFSHIGHQIPCKPQQYYLEKNGLLGLSTWQKKDRTVDTLTSSIMMKLLPDLQVKHTHVYQKGMQNGICEFVFESCQASGVLLPPQADQAISLEEAI